MKLFHALLGTALIVSTTLCGQDLDPEKYREFLIEKEFRAFLAAMPVQMETGGAKIFNKKDGSIWMISVGATETRPETGSELIRRRTVAKVKAQASAVAALNGESVKSSAILSDKSTIRIVDGVETSVSEETLEESIVTEARGMIKGMPVIASWLSKDGKTYFVAIGKQIK